MDIDSLDLDEKSKIVIKFINKYIRIYLEKA